MAILTLPSMTGQMIALDGGQHLQWGIHPRRSARGMSASMAAPGIRHVFLRDMIVPASIGVFDHEHHQAQRVRINVDLAVTETPDTADHLSRVVDYANVASTVRSIVAAGHIKLVETLAERLAAACLVDDRVLRARIRVEKLDVFDDIAAVGVEVERCKSSTTTA